MSEALFRLTDFLNQLVTSPLHWHKEECQNDNFRITLKAEDARLSRRTLQPLGTSRVCSRHKRLLGLSDVATEEAIHPCGRLSTTACLPTGSGRETKYITSHQEGEGYTALGVEKRYFN